MHIIRIPESEFLPLLDRVKTRADVKQVFSAQLEALGEIVNYGTNLIPRSYESSDKGLTGLIVIGTLLRQVVAMLDAVHVLASDGAIYAAQLQARALFEASAYIAWILSGRTEEKCTHYYVHNLRRQLRWSKRLDLGTPDSAAFVASMPDLGSFYEPKVAEQARTNITEISRVLSQPAFTSVNDAFEKIAKKIGREPTWHGPLGMSSIRAILKSLGKSGEYEFFYASYSEVMHGSNYTHHIRVQQPQVKFQPIRELSAFGTVFRFCITAALYTYRAILDHYRPGELSAFSRKYSENWQSAFMGVPLIKYSGTAPDTSH